MIKEAKEEKQINIPVSRYFKRALKCQFSRVEFKFSAGELDVLGYNREERCFHISEGKRSKNIASLGHAIGQLVAYMTMINENGYDFLDRITKEERLELSDFSGFIEKKSIKACFYIGLPLAHKDKLLPSARLILDKLGAFGESIGVLFAAKNKCVPAINAKPMEIGIHKKYERESFIAEIQDKITEFAAKKGIVHSDLDSRFPYVVQFKEKDGNPYLHYEVWIKQHKKGDKNYKIEIGFHLEFAKAHLESLNTQKRKRKIVKVLKKARTKLKNDGFKFMNWGKRWSKVYVVHETETNLFNSADIDKVLELTKKLMVVTKPLLDKIKWGRKRDKKEDAEIE